MAIDRLYQIVCNHCGEQSGLWQDSPRHARMAARHVGWTSMTGDRNGTYGAARLDYCPQCAEKESSDDAD